MLGRGRPIPLCDQVCIPSLASHLRWCARVNDVQGGMAAHHHIIKHDLHRNPLLRNILLRFYGESGILDASEVLFALWSHDVFSYNFMISAFAQAKQHRRALHLFQQMLLESISPDRVTYAAIFSVLASLYLVQEGRFLHACLLHCLPVSVATAIIHMYGKFGSLDDAQLVFQRTHAPDVVAWNCILGVHVDHHNTQEALALYGRMKLEGVAPNEVTFISLLSACNCISDLHAGEQIHFDVVCRGFDAYTKLGNTLVNMYAKLGCIESADAVFEKMPERNVASWNTMIGAHSQRNERDKALDFFNRMQEEGVKPDKITFLNIIPAYPLQDALRLFDTINDGDVVLWNALLSSFCSHRQTYQAVCLFHQMQAEAVMPDESTFVIIISMCASEHGLSLGKRMHVLTITELEHNICVINGLLKMYGDCSSLVRAENIFISLLDRTVVTWTIMLTILTHHNKCAEAVQSFNRMLLEGVLPDRFVFATVLDACVSNVSLDVGKQIHVRILGTGASMDAVMGSALLNMYAGCGSLRAVKGVFNQTHGQNTVCCNAVIMALAHHGQAQQALGVFKHMQIKNIAVDSGTFLGLMTACSHSGLIETGIYFFCLMQIACGFQWAGEHFDSVVDLLGRAGQLKESLLFVDTLHVNPTAVTFRTLLSACCKSGDVLCGHQVANRAFSLEPDDEGCFFLLLNVLYSNPSIG